MMLFGLGFALSMIFWMVNTVLVSVVAFIYAIFRRVSWSTQEALNDLATLLAKFFAHSHHTLSEIFAGMFLVSRFDNTYKEPPVPVNLNEKRPAWMTYDSQNGAEWKKVSRYAELAMAMYTWPTYLFLSPGRPFNFIMTIFKMRINPFNYFYGYRNDSVNGDGYFLYRHTAAFLAGSSTPISALYYANWTNDVKQTTYAIVTDDQTKSIVVAIRGSLSLNDWLTDSMLKDTQKRYLVKPKHHLFEQDSGTGYLAASNEANGEQVDVHGGMFKCAEDMYARVKNRVNQIRVDKRYAGYQLVVTGHSLGAGVTSLLTLMLRKDFPDVRGYAFSPPGTMISEQVIETSKNCVFSIFVGNDCVPRLSYTSLVKLQQDVDKILKDYAEAKKRHRIVDFFINSVASGILSPFFSARTKIDGTISSAKVALEEYNDQMPQLFTPGNILQLVENDKGQVSRTFITTESLQHLVLDDLSEFADHMAMRVRRLVRGDPHYIYYVPFLGKIPLVRQIVEYWY